jgi:hypothetical protein
MYAGKTSSSTPAVLPPLAETWPLYGDGALVTVLVSATRGADTKGWELKVLFSRGRAVVGTVSSTVVAESGGTTSAWDVDVALNGTDGSLEITVTGDNSGDIDWLATAYSSGAIYWLP